MGIFMKNKVAYFDSSFYNTFIGNYFPKILR